jgi:hypothetical protein
VVEVAAHDEREAAAPFVDDGLLKRLESVSAQGGLVCAPSALLALDRPARFRGAQDDVVAPLDARTPIPADQLAEEALRAGLRFGEVAEVAELRVVDVGVEREVDPQEPPPLGELEREVAPALRRRPA